MATVIIIEDNKNILTSFVEILESSVHNVIGAFEDCETAIEFCKKKQPDIAIVDIKLPGMDGVEGIKHLYHIDSNIKSIVISVYDDSDYIFKALSAGAVGYLTKNIKPEELVDAINQALNGGSPMSSKIARKVISYFQTPKEEVLSRRENEVLQILSKGKSYAAIAEELHVSINTIKIHVRNIYEKLHIENKQEFLRKYGR